MANTTGLRSLKDIVKKAIAVSKSDLDSYKIFFQYLTDGYRELRLHHSKRGRIQAKASVDQDLFTVDYPEDLLTLISVGIPINGEIWKLSKKHDVVTTTTTVGGNETYDTDIGEGGDILSNYWYGYNSLGGVNIEGYYQEDVENRRIMLKNFIGTKVWLYYTSSGTSLTGETLVPVLYEPTLVAWILKEDTSYDPNKIKLNPHYQNLYDSRLRYLRRAERSSLEEIWNAFNEVTGPLPKR